MAHSDLTALNLAIQQYHAESSVRKIDAVIEQLMLLKMTICRLNLGKGTADIQAQFVASLKKADPHLFIYLPNLGEQIDAKAVIPGSKTLDQALMDIREDLENLADQVRRDDELLTLIQAPRHTAEAASIPSGLSRFFYGFADLRTRYATAATFLLLLSLVLLSIAFPPFAALIGLSLTTEMVGMVGLFAAMAGISSGVCFIVAMTGRNLRELGSLLLAPLNRTRGSATGEVCESDGLLRPGDKLPLRPVVSGKAVDSQAPSHFGGAVPISDGPSATNSLSLN